MSTLPIKAQMHAALNRLRQASGFDAVCTLLDQYGATANTSDEDLATKIIAACPALPDGVGIMHAKAKPGDAPKPSPRETIAKMGQDFALKNKSDDDLAADLVTVINGAGSLQEGTQSCGQNSSRPRPKTRLRRLGTMFRGCGCNCIRNPN